MNYSTTPRREVLWIAVLSIFSLLYYFSFYNYGLNLSDEGYLVYGARRVLSGQIPGVDFHAYMPGRYLVLSFLFKIFGTNILIERLMWVAVRTCIAILFFRTAVKIVPPVAAFMPTLLVIIIPGPWHKSFELLFTLSWLLSVHCLLSKPDSKSVFLLGLASGATLFFRLEIGLLLFFISAAVIAVNLSHIKSSSSVRESLNFYKMLFRHAFIFLSALFLLLLPYVVFLCSKSALMESVSFYAHELYAGITAGTNPFLNPLPPVLNLFTDLPAFGSDEMLPFFLYFFILICMATTAYLAYAFWQKRGRTGEIFLAVLTLLGFISLYQVFSNPDTSHLLQAGPCLYLVTGFLLYQGYLKVLFVSTSLVNKCAGCLIILSGLGIALLLTVNTLSGEKGFYYTGSFKIRQDNMIKLNSPHAGVFVEKEQAADIEQVVKYIENNSSPDEGLLPLIYLPMFNFLTGRDNPLFYDIFFPHTVSTVTNQKKIIENIKDKNIKFIVATEGLLNPIKAELAEQRFREYGKHIIEFIDKNYRLVEQIGNFVILQDNK